MKLYYYKSPHGNFGDDLNPLIWRALIPDLLDDDDSVLFIGIGTILSDSIPVAPKKVVFGAGTWPGRTPGKRPPSLDQSWRFYCVRGPLTTQLLGIDSSLAVTDPAVLLRQLPLPPCESADRVAYMPHHESVRFADWPGLCEEVGIDFIDPRTECLATIQKIRSCRLLVAEAMHGAIVADTFRVPWIPVAAYDHIDPFKWQDWCTSIEVKYRPIRLPSPWHLTAKGAAAALKSRLKHRWVRACLRSATRAHPTLSSDRVIDSRVVRLQERLEALRRDVASGDWRS